MTVLKRFRSESKMQFYATAQKLRKDIMTLLLKDFGVRSRCGSLTSSKISITDYRDLYHSWRSGWIRFDCHCSLLSLDKTYRRYLNDLQY